jgi:hypothetical protein
MLAAHVLGFTIQVYFRCSPVALCPTSNVTNLPVESTTLISSSATYSRYEYSNLLLHAFVNYRARTVPYCTCTTSQYCTTGKLMHEKNSGMLQDSITVLFQPKMKVGLQYSSGRPLPCPKLINVRSVIEICRLINVQQLLHLITIII